MRRVSACLRSPACLLAASLRYPELRYGGKLDTNRWVWIEERCSMRNLMRIDWSCNDEERSIRNWRVYWSLITRCFFFLLLKLVKLFSTKFLFTFKREYDAFRIDTSVHSSMKSGLIRGNRRLSGEKDK